MQKMRFHIKHFQSEHFVVAFLVVMTAVSFPLKSLGSEQSERLVCPDLHEHQTLLESGKRYAEQHGSSVNPFRRRILSPLELQPLDRSSKLKALRDNLSETLKDKDSNLSLSEALFFAKECLVLGQFHESYEYFKEASLLSEYMGLKTPDSSILRYMALSLLLEGCEDERLREPTYGDETLESAEVDKEGLVYQCLVNAIVKKQPQHARSKWLSATDLYQQSIDAREPQDKAPVVDYVNLALLLEWQGSYSKAKILLQTVQNLCLKDTAHKYYNSNKIDFLNDAIIGFCGRHQDLEFARMTTNLVRPDDYDGRLELLSLFSKGRCCDDAVSLFHSMIGTLGDTKFAIHPDTVNILASLLPCLSDSDEIVVQNFMSNYFTHRNSDAAKELLAVLKEAEKKGWRGFGNSLYKRNLWPPSTLSDSPETLSQFAEFFMSIKDYKNAAIAISQTLAAINDSPDSWVSLDSKFAAVASLDDAFQLSNDIRKSSELSKFSAELSSLKGRLASEIEKRQCLEIAAQLDDTAEKLDRQNLFAKAEELHRDSFNIKKQKLGASHAETLNALVSLARDLGWENKFKESSIAFANAHAIYQSQPALQNRDYANMLDSYAQMLNHAHDEKAAAKIYEEEQKFFRTH